MADTPTPPAPPAPNPSKSIEKFAKEKIEIKEHKFEKIEIKEHKDFKVEKLEKNESKEHKDAKVEKVEKNELKEHKDSKQEKLEKVESKEFKVENKEITKVEGLEKQVGKEKDGKEIVEVGNGNPGDPVEQRVSALEQNVASLQHFISTGQRPDLSRGALSGEPGGGTPAPTPPKGRSG
jgi:hypothetical protein